MAGGMTADFPVPILIDGMISDQTEAATMTPDANPSRTFCSTGRISRFMKKTKADPRAVPRNGINRAMMTGLILFAAKFGNLLLIWNPHYLLFLHHDNMAMRYTVSSNNIQLKSSFEVRKKDFERELAAIREAYPDSLVWNRTIRSLKREWAVHNAFHALGIVRKQTADTDLNWPQKWYFRIGYAIAGFLIWPFIK